MTAGPPLERHDYARIGRQRISVLAVMCGGAWLSLREIAERAGCPEASASARLRDFRKWQFGAHTVDRRRRFGPESGTWEYRLTLNDGA